MNWIKLKEYIVEGLKQPSTWRGIILLITALGYKLSPEWQELIITVGLALVGAIGAFVNDKLPKQVETTNGTNGTTSG